MTTYPPTPFPRKGVTKVQPLRPEGPAKPPRRSTLGVRGFDVAGFSPPWGPRGSVVPRNVRSGARHQFGFTVQLRRHGRYAEFPAEG